MLASNASVLELIIKNNCNGLIRWCLHIDTGLSTIAIVTATTNGIVVSLRKQTRRELNKFLGKRITNNFPLNVNIANTSLNQIRSERLDLSHYLTMPLNVEIFL
jgi:hypothetical protein